ncbi:hypothetical protein [Acinetobacter sp. WCHAc060025]|uniref:hypothetical protein n=1 Tax=Acinetobacter sp. WCHAc060025 TaxID=2518625 RepID=UPI0010230A58|nr:hypothetical protein [Acinetobacter sp. WCHAc060025]RZG78144.1 hypothetical protein EXE09_00835 [Acinetobacter sp. WCHAc060025]
MNIDKFLKLQIHQLVQDFLHRMNQNDSQDLLKYNQVTAAMLEELYEELNDSFENNHQLSIIPFDELPEIMPKNIPLFNIEVMDDGDFINECNIYNFGKITGLILQAYIIKRNSVLILVDPLFRW